MSEEIVATNPSPSDRKSEKTDKAFRDKNKKSKDAAKTAEFKKKYFEYYDDIKISDRQDW